MKYNASNTPTANTTAEADRATVQIKQQQLLQKAIGIVGIAKKAGKLLIGTELTAAAVRAAKPGKIPVAVFLACDASQNTKKSVAHFCSYYQIERFTLCLTTEQLGKATGKTCAVACIGVTDAGLARAVRIKAAQG